LSPNCQRGEFVGFLILANSVSKLIWLIYKRKKPRKKEYYRIFFKKRKELSAENIAEY